MLAEQISFALFFTAEYNMMQDLIFVLQTLNFFFLLGYSGGLALWVDTVLTLL